MYKENVKTTNHHHTKHTQKLNFYTHFLRKSKGYTHSKFFKDFRGMKKRRLGE